MASYGNPNLLSANDSEFETSVAGWSAGANTTIARSTALKFNGAASMQMTATAAGSVTATTATRVAVTAGTEYTYRVPIGRATSASGQISTATVTWYSVPSGGTAISSSSATLSLGTSTGFFDSYSVVACATAPAGATYAALSISVSSVAAAGVVYADTLYFGVSTKFPGNLLSYNVQSIETDTSGWAVTNATAIRSVVSFNADSGIYSMRLTATATGSMDASTVTAYSVTPGTEYLGYGWVYNPNATGVDVYAEIRWLDGGGLPVGTNASTLWTVAGGSSFAFRTNTVGTAPAGAATARLYIRPQATSAGQQVYIDECFLGVAPNASGNLLTYNEYSSESSLPAWTGTLCTLVQGSLYTKSPFQDGAYAVQVTPLDTEILSASLDRLVPIVAGESYKVQSFVLTRADGDVNKSVSARVRIDWYGSDGTLIAADNPDQFYTSSLASTYVGVQVTETRTAPNGAAFARVSVEIDHTATASTGYYIDSVVLRDSPPEYTLQPSDDTGSVTIRVDYVPTSGITGRYSLLRVHQDGSMQPVRGYGGDLVLTPYTQSPILVEDYEVPIGERVWYRIDWYTETGVPRGERIHTQTIDTPVIADPGYVWLKSPGLPATNTLVQMESPLSWDRAARSTVYEVRGRTNPIVVSDVRAGRTGSITVLVWDENASALLNALLDTGSAALIQAMPGHGVEGNLYVSIQDVSVSPLTGDAREAGWRWTLAITEVDRPVGGVQGSATNTWQNVFDDYDTWDEVFSAFDSWADVLISS